MSRQLPQLEPSEARRPLALHFPHNTGEGRNPWLHETQGCPIQGGGEYGIEMTGGSGLGMHPADIVSFLGLPTEQEMMMDPEGLTAPPRV